MPHHRRAAMAAFDAERRTIEETMPCRSPTVSLPC
jgi:hypothetical protein